MKRETGYYWVAGPTHRDDWRIMFFQDDEWWFGGKRIFNIDEYIIRETRIKNPDEKC